MFDNVGVNNDKEAAKRRFYALLLTGAGLSLSGGFAAAWLAYQAALAVQAIIAPVDEEMVEVVLEDALPDLPPPPPPPPPPSAGAEETEPNPDEMTEEIQELEEDVKEEIKEAAGSAVENGVVGGVEGGVIGGVIGGVVGGVLGGQLGVRVMHHSELEIKKQVQPEYPEAAKQLNLGDQRCLVKVSMDEEGVPFSADVSGCPQVFHDEARAAILKWRWYPPKVGKERTKAQTTISIVYKMK